MPRKRRSKYYKIASIGRVGYGVAQIGGGIAKLGEGAMLITSGKRGKSRPWGAMKGAIRVSAGARAIRGGARHVKFGVRGARGQEGHAFYGNQYVTVSRYERRKGGLTNRRRGGRSSGGRHSGGRHSGGRSRRRRR